MDMVEITTGTQISPNTAETAHLPWAEHLCVQPGSTARCSPPRSGSPETGPENSNLVPSYFQRVLDGFRWFRMGYRAQVASFLRSSKSTAAWNLSFEILFQVWAIGPNSDSQSPKPINSTANLPEPVGTHWNIAQPCTWLLSERPCLAGDGCRSEPHWSASNLISLDQTWHGPDSMDMLPHSTSHFSPRMNWGCLKNLVRYSAPWIIILHHHLMKIISCPQ